MVLNAWYNYNSKGLGWILNQQCDDGVKHLMRGGRMTMSMMMTEPGAHLSISLRMICVKKLNHSFNFTSGTIFLFILNTLKNNKNLITEWEYDIGMQFGSKSVSWVKIYHSLSSVQYRYHYHVWLTFTLSCQIPFTYVAAVRQRVLV